MSCGYNTRQQSSVSADRDYKSPLAQVGFCFLTYPKSPHFQSIILWQGVEGKCGIQGLYWLGIEPMFPALETWSLDHQGSPSRVFLICWRLLRVRGYAFLVGGVWPWSLWQPQGGKAMYSLCVCVCLRQRKDFGTSWLLRNPFISSKLSNLLA